MSTLAAPQTFLSKPQLLNTEYGAIDRVKGNMKAISLALSTFNV